jgi:UDP-GlcNAc:undecaprenyl-phosphate/decaprenyl-phosphate GlcNAc-1-phosphate transferase
MHRLLYVASISFAVALLLLPPIIRYSHKKKLVDLPGKRRIHKKITPSLGGITIFAGFITASILFIDVSKSPESFILLTILVIPFIIGLLDDLVHLKPVIKLLVQAITASLIFFLTDIRLSSLYSLFTTDFPWILSYPLTIIAIIIITNSFNLIDGIDGLAGIFSATALAFFGTWFYLVNDINFAIIAFSLLGAVLAFLIFNWEPSRIFMGDIGSLVIGCVLSVLAIRFINENFQLQKEGLPKFTASVSTALCVLIIPLVDTVRIIIVRLRLGISPLTADKRHIHHTLVRLGLSHRKAVLILCTVHFFFIGLAILLHDLRDIYLLGIIIVCATALSTVLDRLFLKHTFG